MWKFPIQKKNGCKGKDYITLASFFFDWILLLKCGLLFKKSSILNQKILCWLSKDTVLVNVLVIKLCVWICEKKKWKRRKAKQKDNIFFSLLNFSSYSSWLYHRFFFSSIRSEYKFNVQPSAYLEAVVFLSNTL